MANVLPMPKSSDFPGNLKPTYDALYNLYGTLTGGLDWQINLHLRGALEVDQGISVDGVSDFSGNVTFTADLEVDGDLKIGASGWTITDSGNDLVFTDDNPAERFRLGDTSSTYAFTATGDGRVTGTMSVGGTLAVDGHSILGNAAGDVTQVSGPLNGVDAAFSGSVAVGATLMTSGVLRVDGNTLLGNGAGDTVTIAGSVTAGAAGVTNTLSAGSISAGGGVFSSTVSAAGFTSAGGIAVDGNSRFGNTTNDLVDVNGVAIFRFSSSAGITLGTASNGRIKAYDVTLGAISIPYYTGH